MVEIKVTSNGAILKLAGELKKFDLDKDYYREAGKSVVWSIFRNIEQQKQADGSPLKRNAPSTNEAKRRARRPLLSLVNEFRRFIQRGGSWIIRATKQRVTVEPSDITAGGKQKLRDLVRWVQEAGYTGWFGLDSKGADEVRKATRKRIKRALRKAEK